MHVNRYGEVVREEWYGSADPRDELTLDAFVITPNHIHGIVFINGPERDPPVAPTLSKWRAHVLSDRSLPDTNRLSRAALPAHKPV